METYIYQAKSESVVIHEAFKTELDAICRLPKQSFDPATGGETNKRDTAYKEFFDNKVADIYIAIDNEFQRVLKNLRDIPLNSIVALENNIRIQRVPSGWIYMHDTYDTTLCPNIIATTSTFVPIN